MRLLGAAGFEGVGDVGAELVVAALVPGGLGAVDVHLGSPVDGAEVEPQPLAGADPPAGGDGERAAVPHPVLVPFEAGELGLHGVRDEDALGGVPADGRAFARCGGGELPTSVEIAPVGAGQLRARILGVGVVRAHPVGPLRAQFVRGVVGAAAPEASDNVAVGAGEAAASVVADVGVDPQPEAVVADDREGVGAGPLRDDLSGPADADIIRLPGGEGEPRFEVAEVEVRIKAGRLELVEVEGAGSGLGVVLALQTVDLVGVVGRGRTGRGGRPGRAERRCEQEGEPVSEASGVHGTSHNNVVMDSSWHDNTDSGLRPGT